MSRALLRPAVAVGLLLWPAVVTAQSGRPALSARLSADSVGMGEAFELRVGLTVPPGSRVYFPDTLLASGAVAGLAPVRWEAAPGPDGGAILKLTYSLIAFFVGTVPVPGLDILVGPAPRGGIEGGILPGGSSIGSWANAPLGTADGLQRIRVARQGVWVDPVFTDEDLTTRLTPRPPVDVLGASWHWPYVALWLLFSGALLSVVTATKRDWASGRGGARNGEDPPQSVKEARRAALRALDGLLADGGTRELYTGGSDVVRRYAARLDPEWGPDLTSSELVRRIERRGATYTSEALSSAMAAAEAVKFGRRPPSGPDAETDARRLRDWIDSTGSATW